MEASVYDPSNMHQDVFAYVDAHAGRRGATLVVAANNSKDKTKADYVCDGVADQYTIQQAINALPSTGGCIQLLDGTYLLDKTGITPAAGTYYLATMSIDNIAIRGLGDATILKLANSAGESGGENCPPRFHEQWRLSVERSGDRWQQEREQRRGYHWFIHARWQ